MDKAPDLELIGHFDDTPVLREMIETVPMKERPTDEKGRTHPAHMSDSEKISEMLTIMRTTQDALENFVGSAAKNPMFKMLGLGK